MTMCILTCVSHSLRLRRFSGTVLICLGLLTTSVGSSAQTGGATVIALRTNANPKRYVYTVQNGSGKTIVGVRIGEGAEKCELSTRPLGWTDDDGLPATSWTGSPGWTVDAFREEESPNWCVDFNPASVVGIGAGGIAQFFVEAEQDDGGYLTAPVIIYFRDGTQLRDQLH